MSIEAMKMAIEFNRYFTSANGVDVPARVSVSRDEWRQLFAAISQQPATTEPVWCVATGEQVNGEETYTHHDAYVPLSDCFPLYTHPAPSVPEDVVRDAERWRIANLTAETAWKHPDHRTSEESIAFNAYRCAVESGLNFEAAIDAAMLAAKEAPHAQP